MLPNEILRIICGFAAGNYKEYHSILHTSRAFSAALREEIRGMKLDMMLCESVRVTSLPIFKHTQLITSVLPNGTRHGVCYYVHSHATGPIDIAPLEMYYLGEQIVKIGTYSRHTHVVIQTKMQGENYWFYPHGFYTHDKFYRYQSHLSDFGC